MANTTAGTAWNLLNYSGELFTASPEVTPILTMLGGLTGGQGQITNNFEFPVAQTYDHETVAQPAITETTSLTAPTAISYVRTQQKNVAQIFHEQVSVSYERLSNQGTSSGINTANSGNPIADELAFQISTQLKHIARDVEYTIIQGSYQIATAADVANKSRGINEAASDASNTVDAGSIDLSDELISELIRTMLGNGALFSMPLIIVNSFQYQKISSIYGYAPTDRNIGGVNIKQLILPIVGPVGILFNRFQSTSVLTIAEMSVMAPVFQPVPGKGSFFYEELSKSGASESGQIFGKFGLNHGPNFMHGTITGLTTS